MRVGRWRRQGVTNDEAAWPIFQRISAIVEYQHRTRDDHLAADIVDAAMENSQDLGYAPYSVPEAEFVLGSLVAELDARGIQAEHPTRKPRPRGTMKRR